MTTYIVTRISDESGEWGHTPADIEADSIEAAAELALDWAEGEVNPSSYGPRRGAALALTLQVCLCERKVYDTTANDLVLCESADGWSLHAPGSTDDDIARGDAPYLVAGDGSPDEDDYEEALDTLKAERTYEAEHDCEWDADEETLIRESCGRDAAACDHDWRPDPTDGCRENPGVWGGSGTAISTTLYCLRCGTRHIHTSLGSQRNPGEADRDHYETADDETIDRLRVHYWGDAAAAIEAAGYDITRGDAIEGYRTVIAVEADENGEDDVAEGELARIRATLPAGWIAEWTGSASGDGMDVHVTREG